MKTFAYAAVIAFGLLVIPAAAPATAQFNQDTRLSAEVPFDFEVAGVRLEAGDYTVTRIPNSAGLVIRGRQDGQSVLVLCRSEQDLGKHSSYGRLVFHKYGDQYFFTSAWTGDEGKAVFGPSLRERQLRKELRRGEVAGTAGAVPEVVTIAAVTR